MEKGSRLDKAPPERTEPESAEHLLKTREEREAEIARFRKFCDENIEPGSLSSLYLEERRALRKIFPNTLVDLGRAGILKMRVFREDGSSYFLPNDEEADS